MVLVFLCLWTTSFSMTIQTKPFASSLTMLGSVFSILQNKFGKLKNLCISVLATRGSESVKMVN